MDLWGCGFPSSESESLSNWASIALIFCPGVSICGELAAAGDAERAVRGVEGVDMVASYV